MPCLSMSSIFASHLGRQEIGELLFTTEGGSKVEAISFDGDGGPVETNIDGLIEL
jgi:hypothetical protein